MIKIEKIPVATKEINVILIEATKKKKHKNRDNTSTEGTS